MSHDSLRITDEDIVNATPKMIYPGRPEDSVLRENWDSVINMLSTFTVNSRVRIIFKNGFFAFYPPFIDKREIDDETIRALLQRHSLLLQPMGEENIDQRIKRAYILDQTGGIGITGRDLRQTIEALPGLESLIVSATKITFVGSGFSSAPVELAQKYKDKQVVVEDLFDYKQLLTDLTLLSKELIDRGVNSNQIGRIIKTINELCYLKNILCSEPYKFGSVGNIPPTLLGSSLVVNTMGPPTSTIPNQLSILEIGGKLITRGDTREIDFGDSFRRLQSEKRIIIIERLE